VDTHDLLSTAKKIVQQLDGWPALTCPHSVKELEDRHRRGLSHYARDVLTRDLYALACVGDDLVGFYLQAAQVAADRPH